MGARRAASPPCTCATGPADTNTGSNASADRGTEYDTDTTTSEQVDLATGGATGRALAPGCCDTVTHRGTGDLHSAVRRARWRPDRGRPRGRCDSADELGGIEPSSRGRRCTDQRNPRVVDPTFNGASRRGDGCARRGDGCAQRGDTAGPRRPVAAG
jgi:hypothetical protein